MPAAKSERAAGARRAFVFCLSVARYESGLVSIGFGEVRNSARLGESREQLIKTDLPCLLSWSRLWSPGSALRPYGRWSVAWCSTQSG